MHFFIHNVERGVCCLVLKGCEKMHCGFLLFHRFERLERSPSWSNSPTNNTMRQAMISSQAGQREYLIKHCLSKKEKEYVDIKNYRWGERENECVSVLFCNHKVLALVKLT